MAAGRELAETCVQVIGHEPARPETFGAFNAKASSVLRDAVAKGPILFRDFDKVHEDVLRPDARTFAEQLRDSPEQCLLLFHGSGVVRGDLDEYEIVTAGDAKIGRAVAEVRSVMLPDGHELVVFGYVERFAHRAVKTVEDRLPVCLGLSGAQGDV